MSKEKASGRMISAAKNFAILTAAKTFDLKLDIFLDEVSGEITYQFWSEEKSMWDAVEPLELQLTQSKVPYIIDDSCGLFVGVRVETGEWLSENQLETETGP